jgi:molecular chaperone GrpE
MMNSDETDQAAEAEDTDTPVVDDIRPEPRPEKKMPRRLTKKQQIEDLTQALGEAQDRALRQRAEFDNYRKRVQRDMADIREMSKVGTIEEMLRVRDHFGMAMMAINQSDDVEVIKQGMNMIQTEFMHCFENLGVSELPTVGETFDPNLHEALKAEPSDEFDEGVIIQEFKAGYKLGDRLIRAATVIVSSGPASDGEE